MTALEAMLAENMMNEGEDEDRGAILQRAVLKLLEMFCDTCVLCLGMKHFSLNLSHACFGSHAVLLGALACSIPASQHTCCLKWMFGARHCPSVRHVRHCPSGRLHCPVRHVAISHSLWL
jgi:hypothetical protein